MFTIYRGFKSSKIFFRLINRKVRRNIADYYFKINRRPTMEEIHEVKNYADELGILYEPVS